MRSRKATAVELSTRTRDPFYRFKNCCTVMRTRMHNFYSLHQGTGTGRPVYSRRESTLGTVRHPTGTGIYMMLSAVDAVNKSY